MSYSCKKSGFALGMMQAAVSIGVSLGPFVGGIIADHFGYRSAFICGSLLLCAGGMLKLRARENFSPPDYEKDGPPLGFTQIMAINGFDKKYIGRAYGVATSISMVGVALGPFLGGTIAQMANLRFPFLVVALAQLFMAFMIALFVETKNNNNMQIS